MSEGGQQVNKVDDDEDIKPYCNALMARPIFNEPPLRRLSHHLSLRDGVNAINDSDCAQGGGY